MWMDDTQASNHAAYLEAAWCYFCMQLDFQLYKNEYGWAESNTTLHHSNLIAMH